MNIYIYGTEKFKTNVRYTLTKANLGINIENINTLFKLKNTIENNPNEIFILDETKIIETKGLGKYFRFFAPKDGVQREFIEKYGIGDVCFNSLSGMIGYIKSRIEQDFIEKKKSIIESIALQNEQKSFSDSYEEEIKEVEPFEIEEAPKIRDLTSLKTIEEIYSDEIEDNMFTKEG